MKDPWQNKQQAEPLKDIQRLIEQPHAKNYNTIVLPKWLIDALKKKHQCDDTGLLELLQKYISYRITKIICADGLDQYPEIKI